MHDKAKDNLWCLYIFYEQSSIHSSDQNLGDQNVSSSDNVPSGCNDDSDGGNNEVDFDFRNPLKNFINNA